LAIDNYGNVVGFAVDESDNYHAILWQPIPGSATVLLIGLGAVMLRRKR
jgi:probable HAF family extracellular repeat protein